MATLHDLPTPALLLDLDLLDERARAMLGYVRREELVIR